MSVLIATLSYRKRHAEAIYISPLLSLVTTISIVSMDLYCLVILVVCLKV